MAFGIDFGTTNSAVVFNEKTCLDTGAGAPFPSVVAVHRVTGEVICGPDAKRRKQDLQDNDYVVFSSVKSCLDRSGQLATVRGRAFTAEDVATELFTALKRHAANKSPLIGKAQLTAATVSIPVGFPAERRRRLRTAAQRAGIEIDAFVSEPSAAFLHCRGQMPECRRVAVFDWGGGTLDVSILEISGQQIIELATEGLQEAGDVIDFRIAEWAHRQITSSEPNAIPFDRVEARHRDKLITACEQVKIRLTDEQSQRNSPEASTSIQLPRYSDKQHVDQPITGPMLNELVKPFVDHAVSTLHKALAQSAARAGASDIDFVLVVGGSSKLWALKERLRKEFKHQVFVPAQPDWAVAQGASYVAAHPGSYRLMQRVCLEMCDGSTFDIVKVGDEFCDRWSQHHLGMVEESDTAQLIFAEPINLDPTVIDTSPRLRRIGNISVPMQGFYRERLLVKSRLTRDLMLEIKAQSANDNEHDESHWTEWNYPQLRFAYSIQNNGQSKQKA